MDAVIPISADRSLRLAYAAPTRLPVRAAAPDAARVAAALRAAPAGAYGADGAWLACRACGARVEPAMWRAHPGAPVHATRVASARAEALGLERCDPRGHGPAQTARHDALGLISWRPTGLGADGAVAVEAWQPAWLRALARSRHFRTVDDTAIVALLREAAEATPRELAALLARHGVGAGRRRP